jgi:hypothetical protein
MQPLHLHLMLNHLPVVGILGATLLLAYATWRGHEEVTRAALGSLVLIAVAATAVFLTGEPAEELVESIAGIDERAIHEHEEWAAVAFGACIAAGTLGLALLLVYRGRRIPRFAAGLALLVAASTSVIMGVTANLGGRIRHTEIAATSGPAQTDAEDH